MNKNIKEMSLEELKALAYDFVVEFNRIQNNIKVLETEIQERLKQEPIEEKKK